VLGCRRGSSVLLSSVPIAWGGALEGTEGHHW